MEHTEISNSENIVSYGNNESVHLIILQHGLHGTENDFNVMKKMIQDTHGTKLIVENCKYNNAFLATHHGIDACGNRLVKEIEDLTEKYHPTKISLVGHSLGGLIIRYAIGILYEKGYFQKVTPLQFITLSSPHCGSRRPQNTVFNKLAGFVASNFISTTGSQLMLEDDPQNPLLLRMANPDGPFYKGLLLFKRRVLYSNISNDIQVNFCTSNLCDSNPYTKHGGQPMKFSAQYPHIIEPVDQLEYTPITENSFKNDAKGLFLRELVSNLQKIAFERYHCYYKNFLSHTNVVVKREWMNQEGLDTVQHFIDKLIDE